MSPAPLWEGTDSSGSTYWIEDGIFAGVHYDYTCGSGDQFYWAANDPVGGFAEHFPGGSVGLNTSYSFRIDWAGTEWRAMRNGSVIGYDSLAPCCSTYMASGGEASATTGSDHGETSGLQKEIGSTWSYNWTGAQGFSIGSWFTIGGTPTSDETYAGG